MKKITIQNENVVNFLESLSYEVNSRKDLMSYMIQSGVKPTDDAFKDYHKEYQDYFVQYQAAKDEFEKEYVRPFGTNLTWNLNFSSKELTVEGVE